VGRWVVEIVLHSQFDRLCSWLPHLNETVRKLDYNFLTSRSKEGIITWEASLVRMKLSRSGPAKDQVLDGSCDWPDISHASPFHKLPTLACKSLCSKSASLRKDLQRRLALSLHPPFCQLSLATRMTIKTLTVTQPWRSQTMRQASYYALTFWLRSNASMSPDWQTISRSSRKLRLISSFAMLQRVSPASTT
jgi:hypothetical protein